MNYEIVELKEKKVAGLQARTKNTDPKMGEIIGGLWYRLYNDGIYNEISNKANDKSLGIYSNYEGDDMGEYDVTIGVEVESVTEAKNLVYMTIPAGKYAKFVVRGNMVTAVQDFWKELWAMDIDRSFVCDFEEYQSAEMEDAEIHMYISMR